MANTNTATAAASVASPATIGQPKDVKSTTLTIKDTASWTGTTAGDTLLLCRVPVSATLDSIRIQSDDLGGTNQTYDIGFYQTNSDITVIDLDAIGTAIAVATANAMTEYRFETKDHTTLKQRVWEIAGLTAEPEYADVYLALTVKVADTPIAGDVSFYCDYSL
tara:strand:- start:252 stop:743 length:492 start_codon:yes stop_codon:yes gene_type:complete